MIEEPDSRWRMSERRIFCLSLTVLLMLLLVGLLVGMVTWYRTQSDAQLALAEQQRLWRGRLLQCQQGRRSAETRLVAAASRVGSLFEEGSPYHRAAQQGLRDANARASVGRPLLQAAAPDGGGDQGPPALSNVTLVSANVSATGDTLAAVQQLYADGVRLFIGFPDSDELLRAVQWASQHAPDAVLVSPTATAGDLQSDSGNPLLLSLGDAALAAALLCLLRQRSVRHLVPVAADTTYGRSVVEELRRAALFDGAATDVTEPVWYRPADAAAAAGRGAVIRAAADAVSALAAPPAAVGLLFVSGAEMRHFLEEGGWDSRLSAAQWFGTDSVALRDDILASPAARAAAVRVKLTALIYSGADAASAAEQWAVLRRLTTGAQQPAPSVLRAYDGAALLAELGHLLLGHGNTTGALAALRASVRAGVTGAAAVRDGSRRAGGQFAMTRVVARADPERELLAAPDAGPALWAVTGQVRIEADPQQGAYLGRMVLSSAGAGLHLVRRSDVRALYAALGGCGGDGLQLTATAPAGAAELSAARRAAELPERLLVSAARPARLELHCAASESGLLHLSLRCPAVQLPGADTVFCLAQYYRLVGANATRASASAVRWRHERRLVGCGAAPAECLDRPCREQRSCITALTDELGTWLKE
ncbi:uncharacterized protein LOC122366086 [Amphibalanus amphitrite]|uniref:uncharacterized protein LOC122366086 n=1 Tax=Amphibalanus amphitrite TaxID=1232801 RepID=UPI001C8FFADC|nr:uncharacterized protein LOC122366086 [Amphibalanus amphitrite]